MVTVGGSRSLLTSLISVYSATPFPKFVVKCHLRFLSSWPDMTKRLKAALTRSLSATSVILSQTLSRSTQNTADPFKHSPAIAATSVVVLSALLLYLSKTVPCSTVPFPMCTHNTCRIFSNKITQLNAETALGNGVLLSYI